MKARTQTEGSAYIDARGWKQEPGALANTPHWIALALAIELGDRAFRYLRREGTS